MPCNVPGISICHVEPPSQLQLKEGTTDISQYTIIWAKPITGGRPIREYEFKFRTVRKPTLIQYNVTACDIALLVKFRSVHTTIQMLRRSVVLSSCEQRACSRSLHSDCLSEGSNPYSPRYKPSNLTNRLLFQTM